MDVLIGALDGWIDGGTVSIPKGKFGFRCKRVNCKCMGGWMERWLDKWMENGSMGRQVDGWMNFIDPCILYR